MHCSQFGATAKGWIIFFKWKILVFHLIHWNTSFQSWSLNDYWNCQLKLSIQQRRARINWGESILLSLCEFNSSHYIYIIYSTALAPWELTDELCVRLKNKKLLSPQWWRRFCQSLVSRVSATGQQLLSVCAHRLSLMCVRVCVCAIWASCHALFESHISVLTHWFHSGFDR